MVASSIGSTYLISGTHSTLYCKLSLSPYTLSGVTFVLFCFRFVVFLLALLHSIILRYSILFIRDAAARVRRMFPLQDDGVFLPCDHMLEFCNNGLFM